MYIGCSVPAVSFALQEVETQDAKVLMKMAELQIHGTSVTWQPLASMAITAQVCFVCVGRYHITLILVVGCTYSALG
jgi:hypothetical protein